VSPQDASVFDGLAEAAAQIGGAAVRAFEAGGEALITELLAVSTGGIVTMPVTSDCISLLEYDVESEQMTVTFTDGTVYDYPAIRAYDFMTFVTAPSKGQFFNYNVRGKW
jgi:KTSC domain